MSQESSPRQETAGCSTESDGKDSSVACPTCGDTFGSTQYMKVHHAQAHGESIAGVIVECDWCGDEIRKQPSNTDGNNYCSDDCYSNARSEQYSGDGHPRWNGGKETVVCEYCGDEYEVIKVRLDETRFCSQDCLHEWRSEHERGENHPNWTRVECECEICGKTVHRQPSQLERMDNVFCSQRCHREYQSIHQVGENHHNYKGGRIVRYGPNWKEQSDKCRERDGHECQICGLPQEEQDRKLTAHHIVPREKFIDDNGNFDWERANRLGNLLTVCDACHRKWEGIPLRPQ